MTGPVGRVRDRLGPVGQQVADLRRRLFEHQPHLNALALRRTRRAVADRMATEETPSDVLDTVLDVHPGWVPYKVRALQHRAELSAFCEYLADREPQTVLELGTFLGGTLYVWARALDTTAQVVTVDRPVWTDLVHEGRRTLYPTFAEDVAIDLVFGDSHAPGTTEAVGAALQDEVDVLFVDGDHTYEGVREDFRTYRQLLADDGVVAFHDIRRHARDRTERRERLASVPALEPALVAVGEPDWGVSEFWTELTEAYDTREFLAHPEQLGMGIGVVEP